MKAGKLIVAILARCSLVREREREREREEKVERCVDVFRSRYLRDFPTL